jgi:hypothetical protein
MKPAKLTTVEAHKYLNKVEIANETLLQIKKDFGSYGESIPSEVDANSGYDFVQNKVIQVLSDIIDNNRSALSPILYQVDLNESVYRSLDKNTEDYTEKLADALIIRELKKVITRHYFKSLD